MAKLLLELEKVIAFYPQLAKLFGTENSADIECSIYFQQLYYWGDKGARKDGFIYKTKEDITQETCLTRFQQDRCRKKLETLEILETKLIKVNGSPTLHYRINVGIVRNLLSQTQVSYQSDSKKLTNPIYTENTTENTTNTPLYTPPEGGWVNKDLLPPEENLVRKKEKKEEVSPYSPEENKQISEVINEFRKINPTIKFYRKDHRSASYEMIKNFGIEKVKGACALAIAAYGKQYAPVITTPSQLNEKFSQLFAYYKANGGIALSGGESLRAAQEVLDTRALLEGYSKQIPIGHLKGCVEQLEATDENIQELISVFRDAGIEISPTSPGLLTAIHEVLRSIVGKKTIRKVIEDFTRRKDEILGLIEEDRVKKAEKEAKEAEQAARPDVIKRKAELQVVIERGKARIAKENAMKEAEAARWRALRANNRT